MGVFNQPAEINCVPAPHHERGSKLDLVNRKFAAQERR